jgi:hypothetical protein
MRIPHCVASLSNPPLLHSFNPIHHHMLNPYRITLFRTSSSSNLASENPPQSPFFQGGRYSDSIRISILNSIPIAIPICGYVFLDALISKYTKAFYHYILFHTSNQLLGHLQPEIFFNLRHGGG